MSGYGGKRQALYGFLSFLSFLLLLSSLSACDKVQMTMPRLSFEETAKERFPFAVVYAFDPKLANATLSVEGCNLPYTIPSGEIITSTFLEESQARFAGVSTLANPGQVLPVQGSNSLTIRLSLVHQEFTPRDRIGEEDRYLADVNLQLLAVYVDAEGKEVAQTPLQYSTRASLWIPSLSSNSAACATGQFDAQFERAANQLVNDMTEVIPQLFGQQTTQPSYVQQPKPLLPAVALSTPVLTFRSMLEDANNNLVLEGGETVVLKVETTNAGASTLENVEITVSGTQELFSAFTSSMDFPINIGRLQPGESRVTEIRGRVPNITENKRGELVISAAVPNGQTPRTHRILASLEPAQHPVNQDSSMMTNRQTQVVSTNGVSGLPYLAVLVGVGTYQDPWPGTTSTFLGQLQSLADVLEVTGVFTGERVKKLEGPQSTKASLEETLFAWARPRITEETVLLFYFYGRALVHASTGEVYLLPYDSSPNGSSKSLIPLQALQTALGKLNTQATLLFLDTPLIQVRDRKTPQKTNWVGAIPKLLESGHNSLIQIRHRRPNDKGDSARMLAGLFGRADHNSDHIITIGELLEDLQGTAEMTPTASLSPDQAKIPLAQ